MENHKPMHSEFLTTEEQALEILERSEAILRKKYKSEPSMESIIAFSHTLAVLDHKATMDTFLLSESIHERIELVLEKLVFAHSQLNEAFEEKG
jgi:hypothetical protein